MEVLYTVMDPLIDCSDFFIDVCIFLFSTTHAVVSLLSAKELFYTFLFYLIYGGMSKIIRGLLLPLHQQRNRAYSDLQNPPE